MKHELLGTVEELIAEYGALIAHRDEMIVSLEARLRAATERCRNRFWAGNVVTDCGYQGHFCPACQADLALLDGTPEPT